MADADRCVCCGEIIAEGSWICLRCERITTTKTERRLIWWKRLRKKFLSFWRSWKSKA